MAPDINSLPDEAAPMPEQFSGRMTLTLADWDYMAISSGTGYMFKIATTTPEGRTIRAKANWYPESVVSQDEGKKTANRISMSCIWKPLFKLAGLEKDSYPEYSARALGQFLENITGPEHAPITFDAMVQEDDRGFMEVKRIYA